MTNSQNYQQELAGDRFSLKVTARLTEGIHALPRDTTERLRAARVRAVANRKPMPMNNPTFVAGSSTGALLPACSESLFTIMSSLDHVFPWSMLRFITISTLPKSLEEAILPSQKASKSLLGALIIAGMR